MNIVVSASAVAWYGAILSSVVFIFEIYKFLRDKARLKISYRTKQEIMLQDITGQFFNAEPGKIFWTVSISNVGTKPVIITQVGVEWKNKKGGALITKDYSGDIQRFTLTPGDSRAITIGEDLVNHEEVKYFYAKDATGKEHKKRINWF